MAQKARFSTWTVLRTEAASRKPKKRRPELSTSQLTVVHCSGRN